MTTAAQAAASPRPPNHDQPPFRGNPTTIPSLSITAASAPAKRRLMKNRARFATSPFTTGKLARLRSYAGVPLRTHDGYNLGTLCVFDDQVREYSDEQVKNLQILASQVMELLEARRRSRLLAEVEQRFRLSFENAPTGMAMIDLNYRVIDTNLPFALLVGRETASLIGTQVFDLVHPADRERKRPPSGPPRGNSINPSHGAALRAARWHAGLGGGVVLVGSQRERGAFVLRQAIRRHQPAPRADCRTAAQGDARPTHRTAEPCSAR